MTSDEYPDGWHPTWRDRVLGRALQACTWSVRRTARFEVQGMEHYRALQAASRPIIFTAWHGMTMMLASFFQIHHDLRRLAIIMPDDWRGANLAVWVQRMGATPFRLNLTGDASMASARKLAQVVRHLKDSYDCYVTPDGPDGPAYVVKPGTTYLARKTQAALLPLGAYTRTGYRLHRWDTYVVPRPFSRISITIGKPVDVPAQTDLDELNQRLTDILHRLTAQARANYYETPAASA